MKTKTNKYTHNKSSAVDPQVIVRQFNRDLRDSILVISLIINAYIFIAWLVLQVTTAYDPAIINYLQNR
jgi:predicted small integral membrane protein